MKMTHSGMLLLPAPAKRAITINWRQIRANVINFYNRFMPEDLKVKTKSDAFYSLTIYVLAIGLIIPYVMPLAAWFVYQAKKGGQDE
jgi:hypothetical protein